MPEDRTELSRYPRTRASIKMARAHARRLADEWGVPALEDDLALVVTELVTNAIVHGKTSSEREVAVTYDLSVARLRVDVRDAGDGLPALKTDACTEDERGRGLIVVEALTDAWGVIPHAVGKSVWCEFRFARTITHSTSA